jgi:hypothetical protein
MIEHGITTTKADFWIHLFPLEARAHWYEVQEMRDHIERTNIPISIGHSADGTKTGSGYLIPRHLSFVARAEIDPDRFLDHFDWVNATDRESGFEGERVICRLLEHRIVRLPFCRAHLLLTEIAQLQGVDGDLEWEPRWTWDAKTERPRKEAWGRNLFVQHSEGGHRYHQIRGTGEERYSEAPPLTKDPEFPF